MSFMTVMHKDTATIPEGVVANFEAVKHFEMVQSGKMEIDKNRPARESKGKI